MNKSTEMKKARCAEIKRKTAETQISVKLNLDGEGKCDIATGIGFLDHMLTLLAKHSFMDIGIVLGEALREALGDKAGIHRYGNCFIPMDETLAQACLDFSGRPFLIFGAEIPKIKLGNYDTEMTEEFFRAIAMHCGLTLHIRVLYGSNVHHIIEAVFKAFARAVAEAAAVDPKVKGVMSSKGIL